MIEKIILSGMGGQGIVSLGYLLASAGMIENKFVSHVPSYGAEMRGGISNCFVIISDSPIASPYFIHPDTAILMYEPAVQKFASSIKENGTIIINSDMVFSEINFPKSKIIKVPANNEAKKLGDIKVANVIMAGVWTAYNGTIKPDTIIMQITNFFKNKSKELIEMNLQAFEIGLNIGKGNKK